MQIGNGLLRVGSSISTLEFTHRLVFIKSMINLGNTLRSTALNYLTTLQTLSITLGEPQPRTNSNTGPFSAKTTLGQSLTMTLQDQ